MEKNYLITRTNSDVSVVTDVLLVGKGGEFDKYTETYQEIQILMKEFDEFNGSEYQIVMVKRVRRLIIFLNKFCLLPFQLIHIKYFLVLKN